MSNKIVSLVQNFFGNGIEQYVDSKTVNPGGVRLYWERSWKARERIHIADPLFKIVKDLPASLYVVSRIRLDESGEPKHTKDGSGFDRQSLGLMLYSQFNATPVHSQKYAKRILAEMPELDGYVFAGVDLVKQVPALAAISEINHRDISGTVEPISLNGCLFLILPSGSPDSAQLWGYKARGQTREGLNRRTTVAQGSVDLDNLEA